MTTVLCTPCIAHPNKPRKDGYVRVSIDDMTHYAHRVEYEKAYGSLPPEVELDHLCRQRACINVEHLESVSSRVNTLRSPIAPAAINARKTACVNGHAFTADNTLVVRSRTGWSRQCRTCNRLRAARRRAA